MRRYFITIIVLLFSAFVYAQQPAYRVILIGDAGKADKEREFVLAAAAKQIIKGNTTVLFLGDNIYPQGMSLPGTKNEKETQDILRGQFAPMREKGAAVYFVPGNHDWDRMGPDGLAKIKRQSDFLAEQNDSLLRLAPADGCPDPVEIRLTDFLTVIAFDSEWWLYSYDKLEPGSACNCKTKEEVTAKLSELLYKNRRKKVLLASHHPFESYGHHGGKFSLKDHIFPFTAINPNLYIPLPVVGSLYPILRKIIVNPEDLHHPLYKNMIKKINEATAGYYNVIHVSGHEHGLQLIKSVPLQVVSGSGSKEAYVRKGKGSQFASSDAGFVVADQVSDKLLFTFYTLKDTGLAVSYTYTETYAPLQVMALPNIEVIDKDSLTVRAHPSFDSVSGLHRTFFGENYRKEYATPTTVPVIKISEIKGGLKPTELGGGHQTKSLRLVDKSGNEYSLRSIEKYPDVLLPEALRETFARDLLSDNMSSNHPFSALIVPPIADAVKVPHANPIIGWVAPDKELGEYSRTFANTLCLLEEREPLGNSDNTAKMYRKLDEDNDNSLDSSLYLRARLLDILIGDWDRHEDQWRWVPEKDGKGKRYKAVPRDRDQVFYINEGFFPWLASRKWLLPYLQGFSGNIRDIPGYLWESRFLNARFLTQFSEDDFIRITNEFMSAVNDDVLEKGLQRLPATDYNLRHDWYLKSLKERRALLPKVMREYYNYLNRIVDIKLTDKNELVVISDAPDHGLSIRINKLSKRRQVEDLLFTKTFSPSVTKEIRLYISKGDDSVVISNKSNHIKLRIIGGEGTKVYTVTDGRGKIPIYEKESNATFRGDVGRLRTSLDNDSVNTAYVPTNLYNVVKPLASIGFNADDGFSLGLGFKAIRFDGFRKKPYNGFQQLLVSHAFSTDAYNLIYKGEWIEAIGKADITTAAIIKAPNNTVNFFGRGNETIFNKTGDFKKFYRTRFNTYFMHAALRWRGSKGASLSIGPAAQFYHFDPSDNTGRFINNTGLIHSYDSNTIAQDKWHGGLILDFVNDRRNNPILPAWGSYISIRLQGFAGLNDYAKSYGQLIPEISFYKSLNPKATIVLAERIGGGVTVGKSAFYQSLFLGGHENLLGYRQYRFAGTHSLYNNLELRIKLTDIGSYIIPGQFGLIGFFDVGRVWEKDYPSDKWHNGVGGGLYFSPIQMTVIKVIVGSSDEGVYPYVTVGMRF